MLKLTKSILLLLLGPFVMAQPYTLQYMPQQQHMFGIDQHKRIVEAEQEFLLLPLFYGSHTLPNNTQPLNDHSAIYLAARAQQLSENTASFRKVDSTMTLRWNNDKGDYDTFRGYYSYDDQGQLVGIENFLHAMNGDRTPSDKVNYVYGDIGKVTQSQFFNWDEASSAFTPSFRYEFAYNSDGYETLEEAYRWNRDLNEWQGFRKNEGTFDQAGNELTFIISAWDTDARDWQLAVKYENTRDEAGKLTLRNSYNWNVESSEWGDYQRFEYHYNEAGYQTLVTEFDWDNSLSDWVLSTKEERSLDDRGNLLSEAIYNWDRNTESWVGSIQYENTYDDEGNNTQRQLYFWNVQFAEWYVSWKDDMTYDERGNRTAQVSYAWDFPTSSFVPRSREEQSFNDDERRTMRTTYLWDEQASDWVGSLRFDYDYQDQFLIESRSFEWEASLNDWRMYYARTTYRSIYFEQIAELSDQIVTFGQVLKLPVFQYFVLRDERTLSYEVATREGLVSASMFNDTLSINALENELSQDSVTLTIHLSPTLSTLVTFMVTVDRVLDVVESEPFQVYPTLIRDQVKVRPQSVANSYSVLILDLQGRIVIREEQLIGDMDLELSGLDKGMYLMYLQTAEATRHYKLLKR